jgi:hypothetical protein
MGDVSAREGGASSVTGSEVAARMQSSAAPEIAVMSRPAAAASDFQKNDVVRYSPRLMLACASAAVLPAHPAEPFDRGDYTMAGKTLCAVICGVFRMVRIVRVVEIRSDRLDR